ncbi:unnamed protein product [Arabidopsis lyrata]|uniref:Uncharacterized protein n=1 Tax=Arabidopsis lyrata subsp. lyrata TaxID=81972 RepID=D7LNX0_ARALL|nr:hypothetical protein ARALYDRAFT_905232 [Arabidopsis lyrata subsp. lyrata]CAH8267156.1 unnamed protein product [Arabidopsis lyrata]CAH8276307.1 unnamed protein product [Arabidopsis lyrata]
MRRDKLHKLRPILVGVSADLLVCHKVFAIDNPVVALLQGHEDLVMEFANVFKRPTGSSGSKSDRDR